MVKIALPARTPIKIGNVLSHSAQAKCMPVPMAAAMSGGANVLAMGKSTYVRTRMSDRMRPTMAMAFMLMAMPIAPM